MTHVKALLVDLFIANASSPSSYSPFQKAVEGLTEDEARWKSSENAHSIYELVNHLIYWNQIWQKRYLARDKKAYKSIKIVETFTYDYEESFEDKKAKLISTLLHWKDILKEEELDELMINDPEDTIWWEYIGINASHNAYHIGQMVYIRKELQLDWQSGIE
ncbi:DinB family protein [Bacillus sp. FJAT-49711]|uniref:DinB family protein n=1 Tax=Bacillus sp. FJAT-49711 TaxID=2833585 RepID=UPI001BC8F022|nr:DinB family protein [Bacillus sp. FJAT-49711]MBS4220430.1 DinB family protein [Bacillus sp. FJAT-49711]